jgi:uncharacterized protein
MEIVMKKKPKNPTIIEGFPGLGLIGTIATEFLISHLKCELIGKIKSDDLPAMVAIHENKIVQPFGIFYSKKYNLVILHAVSNPAGFEWDVAEGVKNLAKNLQAKEIISLESVNLAGAAKKPKAFYYSNVAARRKKFDSMGLMPLKEGIIMGVTASLLLRLDTVKFSSLFVEANSKMPDSKAAAKVIEILDELLGLKVNPKPLLKQAKEFETKLQTIMNQSKSSTEQQKKNLSYVG